MKRHRSFGDCELKPNKSFGYQINHLFSAQLSDANASRPMRQQESNSVGLRKRAASVEESAHRLVTEEPNKHTKPNAPLTKAVEVNDLFEEDQKPLIRRSQSKTSPNCSPSKGIFSLERQRTCSITGQPPTRLRKLTASPLLRTCCLLVAGCILIWMTVVAIYLRNYMAAAHSFSFFCFVCVFFGSLSFGAVVIGLHGCCAANVTIRKTSSRTIRFTVALFLIYVVIVYMLPFNRQEWYESTARQVYNEWKHWNTSMSNNGDVDPQDYFLSQFLETYQFRILSYNIFIRPPGVTSNGNDFKDERLVRFLSHMIHYDIICLQELFTLGSDRWQSLTRAARIFGFYYEAHLKRNLFSWLPKVVDGGVTILSKFPIVSTDSIFFKRASYSTIDCIVAKGVLYAKIELPFVEPRYLHLFSTHLQAGDEPLEEMTTIKLSQLEQAREFIYSKLQFESKELVVFCGDLNVNGRSSVVDGRDSKEYRRMMQLLSAPSFLLDHSNIPLLKWKDVIKDTYGGMHPVTVGDADVDEYGQLLRTWELQLASKGDRGCRKRLDYILFDPRNSGLDVSNKRRSRVETFFVSDSTGNKQSSLHTSQNEALDVKRPNVDSSRQVGFVQLSDHYGVSTCLEYIQSP